MQPCCAQESNPWCLYCKSDTQPIAAPVHHSIHYCLTSTSVCYCCPGPKLFVKPTQKSNRSIIVNAVSHCCLAGHVNRDKVDKALEVCLSFLQWLTLLHQTLQLLYCWVKKLFNFHTFICWWLIKMIMIVKEYHLGGRCCTVTRFSLIGLFELLMLKFLSRVEVHVLPVCYVKCQ